MSVGNPDLKFPFSFPPSARSCTWSSWWCGPWCCWQILCWSSGLNTCGPSGSSSGAFTTPSDTRAWWVGTVFPLFLEYSRYSREYSMFHSCPNGTEVLLTAQGFSLIYLFSLVDILSMGSGNKTKIYPNFTTEKYNLNSWAGFELIRIMYNLIYVNKQDFLYYFKENSVI